MAFAKPMLLPLATLFNVVPLAATADTSLHFFFLFGRHALLKDRDGLTDDAASHTQPEIWPLGDKKAARANAQEHYDYGGNLDPVHLRDFLDFQDQTATKIVPIAPMTAIAVSLSM